MFSIHFCAKLFSSSDDHERMFSRTIVCSCRQFRFCWNSISLSKTLARKTSQSSVSNNDNGGLLLSVFMAAVVLEIVTALGSGFILK